MITWKLTDQQADQILVALQHRPFMEVNGLIGVLMQQAQQQQQQEAQQAQTGQAIGGRAATSAQEQQMQKTQVIDRPFEPAPEVPQAANGLDQRV